MNSLIIPHQNRFFSSEKSTTPYLESEKISINQSNNSYNQIKKIPLTEPIIDSTKNNQFLNENETSRSNSTVKRSKISCSNKENFSPIPLCNDSSILTQNYINKDLLNSKFFLKPPKSNQKKIKEISEGEKLYNAKKKLEEDCEKEIDIHLEICKKLKCQKDFVELKQKELMEELEETMKTYDNENIKQEIGIEALMFNKNKREKSISLLFNTQEKINDIINNFTLQIENKNKETDDNNLKKLQINLDEIKDDKEILVFKLYEEQEKFNFYNERNLMLKEDYYSKQIQNIELACEIEEFQTLFEEIENKNPLETNKIKQEILYDKEKNYLSEKILKIKNELNQLNQDKIQIEIELNEKKNEISEITSKMNEYRILKNKLKTIIENKNENENILLDENLLKNFLDENAINSFNQISQLFDSDLFINLLESIKNKSNSINSEKFNTIIFEYQDIFIKEIEIFNNEIQNFNKENNLKDFEQKKIQLLLETNINSDDPLFQIITLFHITEQIYLNLLNGIKINQNINEIKSKILNHFNYKKKFFQNQFIYSKQLNYFTNLFEISSKNLISIQNNYVKICSQQSILIKNLTILKEELKKIEKEKTDQNLIIEENTIKKNENLLKNYLLQKNQLLKEAKFKYGKSYLEKMEKEIKTDFFAMNNENSLKFQQKIFSLLKTIEKLNNSRIQNTNYIENELSNNIKDSSEIILEMEAKINSIKQELLKILKKEKEITIKIETKLLNFSSEKQNESLCYIKDILNYYKKELDKNCEILQTDNNNKGLNPITRKKLLEEKISNLNKEILKTKTNDLNSLSILEKQLFEIENRIKEKKKRIFIINEYIENKKLFFEPKTIFLNNNQNESSSQDDIITNRIKKNTHVKSMQLITKNENNNFILPKFGKITINFFNANISNISHKLDETSFNIENNIENKSNNTTLLEKQPNIENLNKDITENENDNISFNYSFLCQQNNNKIIDFSQNKLINGIVIYKKFVINKGNCLISNKINPFSDKLKLEKFGFGKRIIKINNQKIEFYKANNNNEHIKIGLEIEIPLSSIINFLISKETKDFIGKKRRNYSISIENNEEINKNVKKCNYFMFGLEIEKKGILDCLIYKNMEEFLLIKDFFCNLLKK